MSLLPSRSAELPHDPRILQWCFLQKTISAEGSRYRHSLNNIWGYDYRLCCRCKHGLAGRRASQITSLSTLSSDNIQSEQFETNHFKCSTSVLKFDGTFLLLVNLTILAVSLRSNLLMFCLHQCRYINTGSFVVYVLVLVLVLWRWNRRASATPVATRFWFLFDIAFKMCSKAILDSPSKVAIAGFGATWVWFGFLFWWFGIITNQRFVMGF